MGKPRERLHLIVTGLLFLLVVGWLIGNLTGQVGVLQILTAILVFSFLVVIFVHGPSSGSVGTDRTRAFRRAKTAKKLIWPTFFMVGWALGAATLTELDVSVWSLSAEATTILIGR